MNITLENNVPFPALIPVRSYNKAFPLGEMDVGQSFFAAGIKASQISNSIAYQRPKKFTSRTVTENGVAGVRVWRLA